MKITYSENVQNGIKNYAESLKFYPISIKRAHEKLNRLRSYLDDIQNHFSACYPCRYRKLGQRYYKWDTQKHYPIIRGLYMFKYEDESKRPWYFSLMVNHKRGEIKFYRMIFCDRLTDSLIYLTKSDLLENKLIHKFSEFYSWMKRLDEVKGARPTYWCQ